MRNIALKRSTPMSETVASLLKASIQHLGLHFAASGIVKSFTLRTAVVPLQASPLHQTSGRLKISKI